MRRTLVRLVPVTLLCLGIAFPVGAQDFQKSYTLAAEGMVKINNTSGNVAVTGYSGNVVRILAFKEGRDRDRVTIEDRSGDDEVNVQVRYDDCERDCQASVRFEVQVPRSLSLHLGRINTASGNITVQGVTGTVRVSTASGDLTLKDIRGFVNASTASGEVRIQKVIGAATASSASGDVDVTIDRLEGDKDLKFTSASGDVRVRLPANLDADVELSSATGAVKTSFPLQVDARSFGQRARGRLGSGARTLRVSTASGNVNLTSF
ncbi:DUF4097 family beta strand repeat-containing protein [Anthocerotibacter panamensis]|uniref:DUF4097 family beta strand repeat-containing protein n=1 Tax=Anthocerotibacter panamensis TaxID=2857077 RepID=UPI001C402C5A|nr:DUF4097 family beta strand repeat-containing protein [Anthocerotibacter panamensis]